MNIYHVWITNINLQVIGAPAISSNTSLAFDKISTSATAVPVAKSKSKVVAEGALFKSS